MKTLGINDLRQKVSPLIFAEFTTIIGSMFTLTVKS